MFFFSFLNLGLESAHDFVTPTVNVVCNFVNPPPNHMLWSHTYDRLTMYTHRVVNTTITSRQISQWTRMVVFWGVLLG